MPHKCRNCTHVIPDKSKSLLEGCPECDNKSWKYVQSTISNNESQSENESHSENKSQQKARTEFVDSENLPSSSIVGGLQSSPSKEKDESVKTISDISTIQEQLNKQYEGIKVVRNGKYKINLTELYRGNDYIIEIGDDGAYTVSKVSNM